jgi:3-isopropylmalate/(R)-2-methylmalate dehydratase large subunit
MRINVEGSLNPAVSAKDLALYFIAQLTTGGATVTLWNMPARLFVT